MKHRRGINLAGPGRDEVVFIGALSDALYKTFDDIREWETLGAHCANCEREGWLLRWELQQSGVLGPILDRLQAVSDVGLAETGEATLGSLEGYLDSNPEATELIGHARTIVSRGKMRRPTR